MRKFNFNSFKKEEKPQATNTPQSPQKPRYSAYRTIISRHEALKEKLKDEPVADIKAP